MSQRDFSVSIGALAGAAGVNVETVRFYQRKGLLPVPRRRYGEIRRYGAGDVARVTHCVEARAMAEQKLDGVRAKLRDLRRMESALQAVVADCRATRGAVTCPLIASLHSTRR